jgi:UDP-3-O-[3-hydroxymyristoyl] glucosamine N-acyltransferase
MKESTTSKVTLTLSKVVEITEGKLLSDKYKENLIFGLTSIEEASPTLLGFTNDNNLQKINAIIEKQLLGGLLIRESIDIEKIANSIPIITVKDPFRSIIKLASIFHPPPKSTGNISELSFIDPTAKIGDNVTIYPFVNIGANTTVAKDTIIHPQTTIYDNCIIGEKCIIHSGVVIREGSFIGNNVVIQPGAIIGGDGFGYIVDSTIGLLSVPQIGTVHISSNVDIGANTTIDRATLGTTVIGTGTKLDNQVQIGHNTKIGEYTIICGKVGIAGSCTIGNQVVLGGDVGIADHITINDKVRVAARGGVTSNLIDSGDYAGHPAISAGKWKRQVILLNKLEWVDRAVKLILKKLNLTINK